MTKKITEIYNNYSDFYQKSLFRRLLIGLFFGFFVWFSIFAVSVVLNFIGNDDIWLETFIHDLPLVGVILALLFTLQIWGLLPQPVNNGDEGISTTVNRSTSENENLSNETTEAGKKQPEQD
ncbi:MAG: hypothetical protein ACFFFH_21315 [Candidatus Thorarchaeota archaeon]